jgi:pimeloyl-ACP methyl ester carboxylesterase
MKKQVLTAVFMLISFAGMAQIASKTSALLGTWTGKLNVGATSLTLVFHFEQADGNVVCTMDSPDQGAKGIGVYKNYLSEDSVSLSVITLGVNYRAKLKDGQLDGTFVQNGLRLPLVLKKGELERRRPQMPAAPYPYQTEDITFVNQADNATLSGTLTYPVGYETMKKKDVPVVIMVSGSGLQNRDEELFDHKPFLVLADHLARHGIASLRYDDRAFGKSEGGDRIHKDATTLDYKRDAEAGIQHLRSLKKFGKVGVIGHSEGGNIAFMLGADKKVDFVVSMAGVGVKVDTALTAQANKIMELQGQPTRLSLEQYRQNVQALQSPWMNWFIDYDPTADISAMKCPVMAINGDKDCQVISTLNLPSIRQLLQKNKYHLVKEYPSLNHLFQHCQTGLPTEYGNIEETISPEVLTDITKWINGVK